MDLVYVTFNSEKWIRTCFQSVLNSEYNLSNVSIYVFDNDSTDHTVTILEETRGLFSEVCHFEIIRSEKNRGFGKANNVAFQRGASDIVCFFNIDTELMPDTLVRLEQAITNSDTEVVAWELRQFPYEHPKVYDVLTHETGWSSGAALAIRREIFEKIGGFDEAFFMYAEDVDLSWRFRSFGYKLQYVPNCIIKHYSYELAGSVKPVQHIYSIINNLYLRYRYGNVKDVLIGHFLFFKCMLAKTAFAGSKRKLMKEYMKHLLKVFHFLDKSLCGNDWQFQPYFNGFDYAKMRKGAYYQFKTFGLTIKVTVVIRADETDSDWKQQIEKTIHTVLLQTYSEIEILIIGNRICELQKRRGDFASPNIKYIETESKLTEEGMITLAVFHAAGKYVSFLGDSLLYADHVEVLVNELAFSDKQICCTNCFQRHKDTGNNLPYPCFMFEKSVFDKYKSRYQKGGGLEGLIRHICNENLSEYIEKTTVIY